MDRVGWTTAVGTVGEGLISVRGYRLEDLIGRVSFAGIVYLTIRGELPTPEQTKVMDAALSTIIEHGFYSPTTAASRMIVSASPDSIIPGLAGALLTIGSVTVSPQDSANLALDALARAGREGLSYEDAASSVVEELIATGQRMPGIGHPLHPEGDPRAIALRAVAQKNEIWGPVATIFELIAEEFCHRKGRQFPINIDGMLACVLSSLGFEPIEMPGIAAISFMPGLIAHNAEESRLGRRLRVVEGDYTGPDLREVPAD